MHSFIQTNNQVEITCKKTKNTKIHMENTKLIQDFKNLVKSTNLISRLKCESELKSTTAGGK